MLARANNMISCQKEYAFFYSPGPKGRWAMDKIYFWERGNYRVYFDFGYPVSPPKSDNLKTKSDVSKISSIRQTAPVIYYVFTQDYMDELLDKASRMKAEGNPERKTGK